MSALCIYGMATQGSSLRFIDGDVLTIHNNLRCIASHCSAQGYVTTWVIVPVVFGSYFPTFARSVDRFDQLARPFAGFP